MNAADVSFALSALAAVLALRGTNVNLMSPFVGIILLALAAYILVIKHNILKKVR